jgi:phosphomannomutase/phosphoglucomutase
MTNTEKSKTSLLGKLKQHPLSLGLILIIVCCFIWVLFFLHHHLLETTKHEIATTSANNYAQQQLIIANTYLQQRQQQLRALSEKDLFIDALASGDANKVEKMERLMADWVDGLTEGFLLSPEDDRLDRAHNFAAQQVAMTAFAGETPEPTAAYINDAWQFILAYPLKRADDKTIGVMLTLLSTDNLANLLNNLDKQLGTTELYQRLPGIPGKAVIALKNNNHAMETVHLKTKVPHWEIRFTGSNVLLNQAQPSYREFYTIAGAVVGLMLLLIYLVVRLTLHHHKDKPLTTIRGTQTKGLKSATDNDQPVDEDRDSYLQILPAAGTEAAPKDGDTPPHEDEQPQAAEGVHFSSKIFRDYDIRGIANTELTTDFAFRLGKALAKRAQALGEHTLVVGSDGRKSSPELMEALEQGILKVGCNVIRLGEVPTPLLNFALHQLAETECGVMVTASHNPAEYNGFKMFFKRHALCGDEVLSLKTELEKDIHDEMPGELEIHDLSEDYVEAIASDIVPADELKVVLDAGNGIAGELGIKVLEAIGCDVIPLYCEVDGNFPHHPPDTSVASNLDDLISCVKECNADLGIALDGDGDRVVAVSSTGEIIWPDELLMIFARDVVSRHPGADVVFDIKSTNRLNSLISSYGGRPVMWKTGHSHMYNKILECEAPVGGEYSGHIFFHDRWYGFDDGIYAAARLVEIMAIREQGIDEMMASFESRYATTEIKIAIADEDKFAVMTKLIAEHTMKDGKISTIDGLRLDLPNAWGLVRASNTSPALTLRFEANTQEALEEIQLIFKQQLQQIDNNLTF